MTTTFIKKEKLYLLFFLTILLNLTDLSPLFAKKYKWEAIAGRWEKYQLDNGNIVMRQGWRYDREKDKVPTPQLIYKTIRIHHSQKDPYYGDEAKFDFKIQSFYSSYGELAIFFGGKSIKEIYFLRLQFHNKYIYNVSLLKSEIKNRKLPEKVFGNFYVENLASNFASIPTKGQKEIKVKRSKKGISLYIDSRRVFSYQKSSSKKWSFYPKTFFAIGTRGAHLWIDNVIISRKGKILFKDNFSNPRIKSYRFKVRAINSKDTSLPTSPR